MGSYLISMIATTIAIALGHGATAEVLRYDAASVYRQGEVWRLITHAFWNQPNIPFLLELTVYFFFGRELERFFGRTAFIYLYSVIFASAPVLGVISLAFPAVSIFAGIPCGTGLFVAFATMAPAVTLFLGISAKWLAVIFVGIRLLSAIASNDWSQVTIEGGGALIAFLATRYFQGRWVIDALSVFRRSRFQVIQGGLNEKSQRSQRKDLRIESRGPQQRPQNPATELLEANPSVDDLDESDQEMIDRILEKISATGLASISNTERSLLESARERLLMRDSPPRT